MQSWKAKSLIGFAAGILLFGLAICPVQAGFTSLYIFGDGVSTTTNYGVAPANLFYGLRNSNGRVWVEVLAQQLGLTNNYWYSNNSSIHLPYTNLSASSTNWSYSSNNWSFFGDFSPILVTNVSHFAAPPDANTALFVVWVNDADFVGDMGNIYFNGYGTNITQWTNAINQSLTNHWNIITNLYYSKSARTLIMPNAVDITEIPEYNSISSSADKSFIRQRVIDFNIAFTALLNQARTSLSGITIYEPDFFTLLDNVLTNAAAYGLTNTLANLGQGNIESIDAIDAENYNFPSASVNGYGTNYIFWDPYDPTAKLHAVLASVVQQLISPARITNLTVLNGNSQLGVASLPIGLGGFVDGTTNLAPVNWTSVTNFNSTNAIQTIVVPVSGPMQFYRLRFPFTWSWP